PLKLKAKYGDRVRVECGDDMKLIRNIHEDRIKKALFAAVQRAAEELDITLVAEGIETIEEYYYLKYNGVELMQGYLFQKPEVEAYTIPDFERLTR
ncbi:MAG: hypothetical protein CMF17_05970, partial [Idiomarinaceae bacterium]|nr:hypothetical protein [Idiomarinaceae bacterium]